MEIVSIFTGTLLIPIRPFNFSLFATNKREGTNPSIVQAIHPTKKYT